MVRFVSHKEHQELSMQSSPQQRPKQHQRSTLSLLTSSAVKQSQIIVMQISPPGRRVQTNAMQTTQLPWLYNLYNNYPDYTISPAPGRQWSAGARPSARQHLDSADRKAHHLLDADEKSSRDCEENKQDQTLGVHFELLSTVMLSIDFPQRRLSSTPNEDDEDDCLFW